MNAEQKPVTDSMSVREAGRIGGNRRKALMEPGGYVRLGKKGGATTRDRHGREHYTRIREKGGAATAEKHGPDFYQAIGRKGGARVKALCALAKALEAEE